MNTEVTIHVWQICTLMLLAALMAWYLRGEEEITRQAETGQLHDEVLAQRDRLITQSIESAYAVGYKDGQAGNPFIGKI